jgi:hypothetical protein
MKSARILVLFVLLSQLLLTGMVLYPSFNGENMLLTGLAFVFWMVGLLRKKMWWINVAFSLTLMMAIFAAYNSPQPLLPLVAVTFSLGAWDLARFVDRLRVITPPTASIRLEMLHLRRLGWTLLAGFLAGVTANFIRLGISFTLTAILAIAVIVILAIAVRQMSPPSKPSADAQ